MYDTKVIQVTQEDIDRGWARDCGKCPIALAAKRAFPDARYVSVTGDIEMSFGPGRRVQAWSMPDLAIFFMDDFDKGNKVTPFTFTAQLMEDY
jgi:hypothetical protein